LLIKETRKESYTKFDR